MVICRYVLPILSLCMLVVAGVTADAQSLTPPRPERPYRGLFGSGVDDPSQLLTVTGLAGGGADDDLLAAGFGQADTRPRELRGGGYGLASAGLSYVWLGSNASLSASGSAISRYYPGARQDFVSSRMASTRFEVRPLRNTRLFASGTVGYQPYNLLGLFPSLFERSAGRLSTAEEDFAITGQYYTRASAQAGVFQTVDIGRRASAEFDYSYGRTELSGGARTYDSHRAGTTLRYAMAKSVGLRAGYHYQTFANRGTSARSRVEAHDLDIGVDLNKPLSLTRQTTLTFGSGSSALVREHRTDYRVTGDAQLSHEIGRSWGTSLGYTRNMRYIDIFDELVFLDAITASLAGQLSRQVEFSLIARASGGRIGFDRSAPRYRMYAGTVTISRAFTRHLALNGSYFFNQYAFDQGISLPLGVGDEMQRHGIRATVTAWAPLLYRRKKN
jgi:hypothetical protein